MTQQDRRLRSINTGDSGVSSGAGSGPPDRMSQPDPGKHHRWKLRTTPETPVLADRRLRSGVSRTVANVCGLFPRVCVMFIYDNTNPWTITNCKMIYLLLTNTKSDYDNKCPFTRVWDGAGLAIGGPQVQIEMDRKEEQGQQPPHASRRWSGRSTSA